MLSNPAFHNPFHPVGQIDSDVVERINEVGEDVNVSSGQHKIQILAKDIYESSFFNEQMHREIQTHVISLLDCLDRKAMMCTSKSMLAFVKSMIADKINCGEIPVPIMTNAKAKAAFSGTDIKILHLKRVRRAEVKDLIKIFPDLKQLSIEFASTQDTFIKPLGNLINLEHLDICEHSAIGSTALRDLAILNDPQSPYDSVTNPAKLNKLRFLSIRDSYLITDAGLAQLTIFRDLHHLDISKGFITDDGLEHLTNFRDLKYLDISRSCKITSVGLQKLGMLSNPQLPYHSIKNPAKLSKLEPLDISRCKELTDDSLVYLMNFRNLLYLDICGNDKITDAGLENLAMVSNPQLPFDSDTNLAKLNKLRFLRIGSDSPTTATDPESLDSIFKLRLIVWPIKSPITDAGLAKLTNLSGLQDLSIILCRKITGTGFTHLTKLDGLRSLEIESCNNIKDAGLAHLQNLSGLRRLEIKLCGGISKKGVDYLKSVNEDLQINYIS